VTTPYRTATNIRIKTDGSYVASIDGRDFGNIKEGSNLMPLVQKALDDGAVPVPYVGPGDTPAEKMAVLDKRMIAVSARTLEDRFAEQIANGVPISQDIQNLIAEREGVRGQL